MSNNNKDKLNEITDLLKKVADNPNSVTDSDKKQIKKLIGNDSSLIIEALQGMLLGQDALQEPISTFEDNRSNEEIIADNYIYLAKFAIEKLKLNNHELKVQCDDDWLRIYILNPHLEELDFEQFCTSDYPKNKELLLEAEALQADLNMDNKWNDETISKIIEKIESAII